MNIYKQCRSLISSIFPYSGQQDEHTIGIDSSKTYPRANENIPLAVTPADCSYYLEQVLGCREVFELGQGAFGTGFSVVLPQRANQDQAAEPKPVVVKAYRFGINSCSGDVFTEFIVKMMRNEITCYQKVKHENIVKFYSCFKLYCNDGKEEYFVDTKNSQPNRSSYVHFLMGGIVLEKLQSTLAKYLVDKLLDERLIKQVFDQIGSALVCLHRTNFTVHRDLHGDNIGISHFTEDGTPFLKLLDLGSSRLEGNAKFNAAQRHSTRAHIESDPASIKVIDASTEALNDSSILSESRQFAQLIMHYATKLKVPVNSSELKAFNDAFRDVPMNDHKLKQMLLRMSTKENIQTVNLAQAWDYLKL